MVGIAVEYVLFWNVINRSSIKSSSVLVFFIFLINSILIREAFLSNGLSMFGPDPVDALSYLNTAKATASKTLSETFAYFGSMSATNNEFSFDDYGMSLIARFGYILGGDDAGYSFVMLVLSAAAFSLSFFFFYKAASQVLHPYYSKIAAIIYGLCTSYQMIAVYGLKENFFMLPIVISLYFAIKYIRVKKKQNLFGLLFFCAFLCLFRFAVCAQLLAAFFAALFIVNSRHKILMLISISLLGAVALSMADIIISFLGGSGVENYLAYAQVHNETSISITAQYVAQAAFAFLGQPPLYTGEFGFNHLAVFSCNIRCILTIPFLYGLIYMVRKLERSSIFLALYWLFGTIMLIVVFRASDFRYAAMYFPAFILLSMLGFQNRNIVKHPKIISLACLVAIVFLTIAWNM